MANTPSRNLKNLQTANEATTGDSSQHVSVTDILCEGPIHGLVNGTNSVYLNDVSSEEARYARYTPPNRSTITFSGGSDTTGVIDDKTFLPEGLETSSSNPRRLWLTNYKTSNLTISTISTSTAGVTTITHGGTTLGYTFDTVANTSTERVAFLSFSSLGESDYIKTSYSTADNSFTVSDMYPGIEDLSVGDSFTVYIHEAFKVTDISSSGVVTVEDTKYPDAGSYSFYLGPQYQYSAEQGDTRSPSPTADDYFDAPIEKVDNIYVQQRTGWGIQEPLLDVGNVGGAQVTSGNTSLITLRDLNMLHPTPAGTTYDVHLFNPNGMPVDENDNVDFSSCNNAPTVMSSSSFGLDTSYKISQCDKVSFIVGYPQFTGINNEKGERIQVFAKYDVRIRLKRNGVWQSSAGSNWNNLQQIWEPYLQHKGKRTGPTTFDHVIDLSRFRPFEDFDIRIIRVTRHEGLPVGSNGDAIGSDKNKYTLRATSKITALQSYNEDLFSYPYTASVNTSFSSKQYSSTPSRSYDIKGKLVRVPSSYTTREESDTGIAKYEDFWDGSFKDTYEYTDNPAWIFYDIITNNRYGAGKWIKESQVDKYALYRIAKYCDELVDTGFSSSPNDFVKGEWYTIKTLGNADWNSIADTEGVTYSVGDKIRVLNIPSSAGTGVASRLEPRFVINVFLAKGAQVYKVLKDLASSFTAILYWMDGALTLVQDTPGDAVYTFTKGNVIDGAFAYETTSERTKFNQVIVQWNDPDSNYQTQQVIVEDSKNISSIGRVIPETVVSFGTTSESQAIRYGRWKLWTSQNQTEAVKFATALQGVYLKPGDLIHVQDADRQGISYSGRISNAGNDYIDVDRDISFNSGSTYEVSVLHIEPKAIYVGVEEIEINSVTYSRGDFISQAYVPDSDGVYSLETIDTEEKATNAFATADSTQPIPLVWKKHTYSKTYPAGPSALLSQNNRISLTSGAWESTPKSVWALKEISSEGFTVKGSFKTYKILDIAMQSPSTYGITAIEHYNEKFSAIDTRYELGVIPATVYPEVEPEYIPPPENVTIAATGPLSDPHSRITVFWTEPDTTFVAAYEIKSNIPEQNLIRTSNNEKEYNIRESGLYTFRVRTVSPKGNYSSYVTVEMQATPTGDAFERVHGLPKGAYANYSAEIIGEDTEEIFQIEKFPLIIASVAAPGNYVQIEEASGNGAVSLAGVETEDERELYILLDHSEASLLLAEWDTSFTTGPGFWRDVGDGTAALSTAWVSVGAASISANSNELSVTTSDLEIGDIINLSDTDGANLTYGAKVLRIKDASTAILDTSFEEAISVTTAYRNSLRLDTTNDAVVALVKETA